MFNPLNAELNPICYLLALLGAHHFLHVGRVRVKSLILRLLMSYIYIYIYIYIYDISSLRVKLWTLNFVIFDTGCLFSLVRVTLHGSCVVAIALRTTGMYTSLLLVSNLDEEVPKYLLPIEGRSTKPTTNFSVNFTFIFPCIASTSLKYNQQVATFSRSSYFYKLLYMFQAVFPPIFWNTKLYIQRWILSNWYCCSSLNLTIPDAVCTILCSLWGAEEPRETDTAVTVYVWQYLTLYVQFCAPYDGRRNRLKPILR